MKSVPPSHAKWSQEGHEPLLKKSRWCVLKRKQNLTSQQSIRLRELLRYKLQTARAYLSPETCLWWSRDRVW